MKPQPPQYDFSDQVFKTNLRLRRLAREHQQLASIHSLVIHWEAVETVSPLHIPVVYHVHYRIKSIVGIQPDQSPVYGDHHILELSIPELYPLEACKIAMKTDVWHPNIKSEGRFKGRVCSNTNDFGLSFDLYQMVLRIGEILQYKNYHAEHTPPFPEDIKVAQWVLEYAEPNGIVNKHEGIFVDDTPLLYIPEPEPEPIPEPIPPPILEPIPAPIPGPLSQTPDAHQIKISAHKPGEQTKKKITITPKE